MKKTAKKQKRRIRGRKNPLKPLDFYLAPAPGMEDYKTYVDSKGRQNLTVQQKIALYNAFSKNTFTFHKSPYILKYGYDDIPYFVGYISTPFYKKTKYIIGIVELYLDKREIEIHDFANVIKRIPLTINPEVAVDKIFENLLEFYIRTISADVHVIVSDANKHDFEKKRLEQLFVALDKQLERERKK